MGTVIAGAIDARRFAKANLSERAQSGTDLPPGCKGAACPAFALCQGRCGTTREKRVHPDGGVWIETR